VNTLCARLRRFSVGLFAFAIVVAGFGVQPVFSQTERASVSGRVTDQHNAAVPDAEVHIRNTDTNIVTAVHTTKKAFT
jgi:hypothetical protein